jgi:hypothetical protein
VFRRLLVSGAALALSGCASTTGTQNLDAFIATMAKTNCDVTISTAAQVGMLNPGSGVSFQAQAHCPNGTSGALTAATNSTAP